MLNTEDNVDKMLGQKKNKKKSTKSAAAPSKEHPYFKGHKCYIPSYKLSKYEIQTNPLCKFLLRLVVVRKGDARTRLMYRSFDALCAERYRHYKKHPCSIHPFSALRFAVELMFIITNTMTNFFVSMYYSLNDPEQYVQYEVFILILEGFYVVNIIMNFFTGYVVGDTSKYVVLDNKKIACRYLKSWFFVDALSTAFVFYDKMNPNKVYIDVTMMGIKILRMPTMIFYLDNIFTACNVGILKKEVIKMLIYLMAYLVWNVYFQFATEYLMEGTFTPVNPRNCSWITIAQLWNASFSEHYAFAVHRAVGMLRGNSNLHLINQDGCFELFFIISGIIAKLLVLHCALKYMIALFGVESAKAKYYMMTKQVENYMNQKKFPPRIKKKILKFYAIRYQSKYFNEAKMMAYVSGKLREDMIMHSGRKLVSDVEFLKTMPRALLLQVEMKLKIVVFIAGDIILKFNTVGDCLYFIDKGTVAVYSESGQEVCHLDDGDYFGEIALVMKHRFRTASVVAVTNCELFRLNKEDFESTIACYPTVYEDIKRVAAHRSEKTSVLDEHHKSELRDYDKMVGGRQEDEVLLA